MEAKDEQKSSGDDMKRATEEKQHASEGNYRPKDQPGAMKRAWDKLDLNVGTLLIMFKGACAPIISLALYQYDPFAQRFPTLGYLVAIASILSMPIMPRAKFMQTMMFNIIAICIGAAIALLVCYCAVQARQHTSIPRQSGNAGASGAQQAVEYNSSASAVSAIWLFFNIMFANALRFARPQLQLTIILYSIFANIACTFSPIFATMAQSISFVEMLLEAFLSGFGIATIVHFIVVPMSSRQVIVRQFAGYIGAVKASIVAQRSYLQSMEHKDMLEGQLDEKGNKVSKQQLAAKALKVKLVGLTTLHGKLHGDLPFAKREVAIGKLGPKDLDQVFGFFRSIFLPLIGLGSVADIFSRVSDARHWNGIQESDGDSGPASENGSENSKPAEEIMAEQEGWNEIMQALHEPFEAVSNAAIDGLEHVTYALQFADRPKDKETRSKSTSSEQPRDIEANQGKRPGDLKYGEHLESKLREFNETRKEALRAFCILKGIDMDQLGKPPADPQKRILEPNADGKNRQQLYLILYTEYLLQSTAQAVLDLVHFADSKVEDGTMSRSRLILPGWRRLKKWLKSSLAVEDSGNDNLPDSAEASITSVQLGDAFGRRKDPEHLPPKNGFEKFGNGIRAIGHTLRSPEVTFGFRVACATMSIAIIAYLRDTQTFFIEQRLVWAMIMVAIGMTMTSGSGVFGFLGRVGGTFLAMVISLVVWYIAGGRGVPGGVLPVLFVFMFLETYCLIKLPRFTVVSMITMVTEVLILGYELQAQKIGVAAVSSNGQRYYPVYMLAPYRLAAVVAGCFVAFVWTYFPYPVTARTALRNQLGEAVYLLANFYSCVHTTIGMRLSNTGGDSADKKSPVRQLEKARMKLLGKQLALLSQLRQHSAFIPFEFSLGGKFPKDTYDRLIMTVQHLLEYMALMSYSTRSYSKSSEDPDHTRWLHDLSTLSGKISHSSQEITSLLILVSSSLVTGSPLPPYLTSPQAYRLTTKLNALDPDLLSLRHVTEPGYAAFAVTQVAGSLIRDDLGKLLDDVKALVGEVDFSFHIISTANDSESTLRPDSGGKGKQE